MKNDFSAHERLINYSQIPAEKIFEELDVPENGLNDEKAAEYRSFYGSNKISKQNHRGISHCLRRAFINPFSVVLFISAVISFATNVLSDSSSELGWNNTTVIIIICMLVTSGIVRFIQEMNAKRITDNLIELVDTTVNVRRNDEWCEIPPEELVVGDIVRMDAGSRVPADIRLISVNDFFISQSVITGESSILEKKSDALSKKPESLTEYTNTVFLGSTAIGGNGMGIVVAVGEDTVYGGFSSDSKNRKNGFDKGEHSIASVMIKFMLLLVPIVFLACGLTKVNWIEALLFSLSVAVGLMPELLPMVITACLARGSSRMEHTQTVVKSINAMQGFGSMDILCMDKTGTLTQDTVLLEYYMDVLGNESMKVLDYAYINSFYHTGIANHLDRAVLKAHSMPDRDIHFDELIENHQKKDEFPFDYNRRFASVLIKDDDCNMLIVKGSVDEVVKRCGYVEYNGDIIPIGENALESVHNIVDEMTEDGMKVLAIATKQMQSDTLSPDDENSLVLTGYIAFFDSPKQSAESAIKQLHKQNINIRVLTGDNVDVAVSVCRRLGISTADVITGAVLDNISDNEFPVRVEKCNIFAELSPKQKSYIVKTLQDNGHSVGFLGDGMNDLPAVVQADVGISVDTATEAVKESADVILLKKDLNILGKSVLEGRKAFANMSKYIRITASSNFGNICAIVVASVLLPFLPMTSVQLLLLNLLYDILCLIMPWDNVDEDMTEKPLEWTGKTLGRFMLNFGPISSVFDILTFSFLYFYLCPTVCGNPFEMLSADGQSEFIALFQTGWFLESMWTQVLILNLLRTNKLPFVQSRPSKPVAFMISLGIIVFTLLTVSPIGEMIGLTAMPAVYFIFLIVNVLLYLSFTSLAKYIYIRKYHELK